jgi:UDP-N-acetylmuramyl pentapeptide phosphotransferase/UDP-N-acetylglucosamine-1-phosphate transferase
MPQPRNAAVAIHAVSVDRELGHKLQAMLELLVITCVSCFLACAVLLRAGQDSGRRYALSAPQRFHLGHVPRLGGAAMFVACSIGWVWMTVRERFLGTSNMIDFSGKEMLTWWLVVLACVASGVAEDVTHRLRASWRLICTMLAAVLGIALFGLKVPHLGLPLDAVWQTLPWIGIGIAVIGLTGLPHAFNLIDGYNGLAGTVSLICGLALAYVALQVGDRQLAAVMMVLVGATAGFLLWNFPHGLIFSGDGGAYLWGIVIAITSTLLVQRHPQVSPWFPVLLLIYPIWETLFSIYRKIARGLSPSVADALHFHQLIFRRIVRQVFHDDAARRMLIRNNRTSPYLWGFSLLTVIPAVLFWRNTLVLVGFTLLFIVSYLWAYHSIVRFRMQRWLRRPPSSRF